MFQRTSPTRLTLIVLALILGILLGLAFLPAGEAAGASLYAGCDTVGEISALECLALETRYVGNIEGEWDRHMKILAIEKELPGLTGEDFKPLLAQEANKAWELYQAGVIRELYFRQDEPSAILILECKDASEARDVLDTLPLVKAKLITFDIIPLVPYPGFSRLFEVQ